MQRCFRIHDLTEVSEFGRVGVVEKIDFQSALTFFDGKFIPVGAVDGKLKQLGPQGRTADTVDGDRSEAAAGGTGDLSATDFGSKIFNGFVKC